MFLNVLNAEYFQSRFLLKMTILGLHEGKASNGQFPMTFLFGNDHSEPPRGESSEWSISNEVSYSKLIILSLHEAEAGVGSMFVNVLNAEYYFQSSFLLKMTILSLHAEWTSFNQVPY
jgi:hypothetical protein